MKSGSLMSKIEDSDILFIPVLLLQIVDIPDKPLLQCMVSHYNYSQIYIYIFIVLKRSECVGRGESVILC